MGRVQRGCSGSGQFAVVIPAQCPYQHAAQAVQLHVPHLRSDLGWTIEGPERAAVGSGVVYPRCVCLVVFVAGPLQGLEHLVVVDAWLVTTRCHARGWLVKAIVRAGYALPAA